VKRHAHAELNSRQAKQDNIGCVDVGMANMFEDFQEGAFHHLGYCKGGEWI
jgi:hypothetical protein